MTTISQVEEIKTRFLKLKLAHDWIFANPHSPEGEGLLKRCEPIIKELAELGVPEPLSWALVSMEVRFGKDWHEKLALDLTKEVEQGTEIVSKVIERNTLIDKK
jgi:hypothetical protein